MRSSAGDVVEKAVRLLTGTSVDQKQGVTMVLQVDALFETVSQNPVLCTWSVCFVMQLTAAICLEVDTSSMSGEGMVQDIIIRIGNSEISSSF